MTPTHATKAGVRYRYYISTALIQGQTKKAATLSRVPAAEIEQLVVATVRQHVRATAHERNGTPEPNDKDLISTQVARVDVKSDHLVIRLAITPEQQSVKNVESDVLNHDDDRDRSQHRNLVQTDALTNVLTIPWKKTPAKRSREIIPPVPVSPRPDTRPIRAETRAKLIASIAKGRQWLEEWTVGTVTSAEQIAVRENCTVRQVNMIISLAFLAPVLVQAAVEGRLPRGVGVANLRNAPPEWYRQHAMLGLST
jgi:site-specific DNA recombinase